MLADARCETKWKKKNLKTKASPTSAAPFAAVKVDYHLNIYFVP